jgi:hypothetical protein
MADTLRAAIYQRLSTDSELRQLLGQADGIYHHVAPATARSPYIVFQKQTGNPSWTFGIHRGDHLQQERWLIKAVCSGRSASPAEKAADRADELLHDAPLVLDDATVLFCRRVSDVDYPETSGPDLFHHVGAIYRIDTAPS